MYMVDGLAAIAAAVHYDAVAAVETKLDGKIANHKPEVSDEAAHPSPQSPRPSNRLLGNHEHMNRGLRRHVVERETALILETILAGISLSMIF